MSPNEMLDEVHRIAIKMHGGGTGVTVREERPGEWFIQLYKSSYKGGNHNLTHKTGGSYPEVVRKLHEHMQVEELKFDALKQHKDRYCWSSDGERFYGEFLSVANAIDDFRKENPDAPHVWVAKQVKPDVRKMLCNTAATILEKLDDEGCSVAGESAEDWLENVPLHESQQLEERIAKVVEAWLTETGRVPHFYGIEDVHKYSFPASTQVAE